MTVDCYSGGGKLEMIFEAWPLHKIDAQARVIAVADLGGKRQSVRSWLACGVTNALCLGLARLASFGMYRFS